MSVPFSYVALCASLSVTVVTDRYVLVGGHYDSATYGAVGANSGTAVLMELANAFSRLTHTGQPVSDAVNIIKLNKIYSISFVVITSAKEVMFLPGFVCLFVCLSVSQQDNSKSYGRIFLKLWGNVGHGINYKWFNFGRDPAGILDSGSLWNFRYYCVKGDIRKPLKNRRWWRHLANNIALAEVPAGYDCFLVLKVFYDVTFSLLDWIIYFIHVCCTSSRRGVVVTRLIRSAKLLYAGPG